MNQHKKTLDIFHVIIGDENIFYNLFKKQHKDERYK